MQSFFMRSFGVAGMLATFVFDTACAGQVGPYRNHEDLGAKKQSGYEKARIQLGPRPYYLIDDMDEGPLKRKLDQCREKEPKTSDFSIGHRGGAPLQFPEHTRESFLAGARMGAGILECDVTFTQDEELVCRHDQCDLHTTTNVLAIPELAAKCSEPFSPYDPATGKAASAKCCTSDFTLAEFKQLCGKMDAFNPKATTVAEYMDGTAKWRTDLYSTCGTLLTHKESIDLIDSLGLKFTPELKTPVVPMPYQNPKGGTFTQEEYAQKMIDEYKAKKIDPKRVWAQSFLIDDVKYWVKHEPRFGKQAVYLDARVDSPEGYAAAVEGMGDIRKLGIRIIAPPMWALLTLGEGKGDGKNDSKNGSKKIIPSDYAHAAKKAGLDIITWTLERSGQLKSGGGYYYQSMQGGIDNDGDAFTALDVLARQVGVLGVFSDWAATTTYYANCMGLK
jgi:glycerophosphoryl diester phosphodiesterase